jgi:hypothetical protein
MPQARSQTHVRVVGELIATDPDAESCLREARHRRVLAVSLQADAAKAFAALQNARRHYEDLRNLIDPQRRRSIPHVLALGALAAAAVALFTLNRIELRAVPAGGLATPLVLGATAVWLSLAWRAALASRDHQRRQLLALLMVGAALAGLLAMLQGHRHDALPGIMVALLVVSLAAASSAVIERAEPVQLLTARLQWRRAQRAHAAAARDARAATDSAATAMAAWLAFLRSEGWRSTACERLVNQCLAYGEALVAADV